MPHPGDSCGELPGAVGAASSARRATSSARRSAAFACRAASAAAAASVPARATSSAAARRTSSARARTTSAAAAARDATTSVLPCRAAAALSAARRSTASRSAVMHWAWHSASASAAAARSRAAACAAAHHRAAAWASKTPAGGSDRVVAVGMARPERKMKGNATLARRREGTTDPKPARCPVRGGRGVHHHHPRDGWHPRPRAAAALLRPSRWCGRAALPAGAESTRR